MELLRSILDRETASPYRDGPVFVLLPEYALRLAEVQDVIDLLGDRNPSLIVVAGIEQMTEDAARAIDDTPGLWEGSAQARYTNCAMVASAGRAYLQPKTVPSQWETERFWPGRAIRYFSGINITFVVQICSDLLQQPPGGANSDALVNWLAEHARRLDAVVWVQHNEKPRSTHFSKSLSAYCSPPIRATVLAAGSRRARPRRLDNYSVCGVVAHHSALSHHFHLLDREFHYFEPVPAATSISRGVLLRYDADAYLVHTVLADSVFDSPTIERGVFLQSSQPYVARPDFGPSLEHWHLADIIGPCADTAAASSPVWAAAIHEVVTDQLVPLTVRDFLGFLDLALIPRPQGAALLHPSGIGHDPADLLCDCWDHRRCIDSLTNLGTTSAAALVEVLTALGAMRAAGLVFTMVYLENHRTYLAVQFATSLRHVAVVHPFGLDAAEVNHRLSPERRATVLDAGYVILGTKGHARRLSGTTPIAAAPAPGPIHAGRVSYSGVRALYSEDLEAAIRAHDLARAVEGLFTP
jgi:hypothetical protein